MSLFYTKETVTRSHLTLQVIPMIIVVSRDARQFYSKQHLQ